MKQANAIIDKFLRDMQEIGYHATVFADSADELDFGTLNHESTMVGHVRVHSNFNSHLAMATSLYDCIQFSPEMVRTIEHIYHRQKADSALGFQIDPSKIGKLHRISCSSGLSDLDTETRSSDTID